MKFKSYEKSGRASKCGASILKNGRLGLTKGAIEMMGLDKNKYVAIGYDEDDSSREHFYIKVNTEPCKKYFKINYAGNYRYLNTVKLFKELKYDYKHRKINFTISKVKDYDNLYKMEIDFIKPR